MEADFSGASLTGSLAHGADFRGGHDLSQRSLSSLIGDAATLLPDTPDLATGQALFVCSCWTGEPYWIRRLIALFERRGVSASDFRDPKRGIICAEGEAPQKTGTPWPFDRIPAWDQQHADESDADYATRVADRERLQNRGDCPAR